MTSRCVLTTVRAIALVPCVLLTAFGSVAALGAQASTISPVVQIERPMSFDAAQRLFVLTPTLAARLKLSAPDWPLGGDWTEARLFQLDTTASSPAVLVAHRVDGAVARYVLSADGLSRLQRAVTEALLAQGAGAADARGGTSMVLSEPAGNAFVRNQTTLGLIAYGPATSYMLSESSGQAAFGGYLVAAGTSFFVAANMVRSRSITRAQTILSFHGGTRGSAVGAAVATIIDAEGGVGRGLPILAGALGGTVAGFSRARGFSDGEAASSGFVADISALTTLGIAGAFGAFKDDEVVFVNGFQRADPGPPTRTRVALGLAIGSGLAGYAIGPRYARRSAYNVTAGDVDVALTSALLGATLANAVVSSSISGEGRMAVSTGGLILGALAADWSKVRHADRTSSDGTLVQLGAIAGALMGGGFAVMADAEEQAAAGLVAVGGFAGLALADAFVRPARDAGPKRGVLRTGSGSETKASRLSLSVVPGATTLLLHAQRRGDARVPITERPTIRNVPMVRIAF